MKIKKETATVNVELMSGAFLIIEERRFRQKAAVAEGGETLREAKISKFNSIRLFSEIIIYEITGRE